MTSKSPSPPSAGRGPRAPASSAWLEIAYALSRAFKFGGRRYEFERHYRRGGDVFGYRENRYELEKYTRTRDRARAWRPDARSALEVGCSVGVFTAMLAEDFSAVTAVDIANEALTIAARQVGDAAHVAFARSDLLSLDLGATFDVVFCAEVLMYIPETEAARVVRVLDAHLAPGGLIIEVSPLDRTSGAKFFRRWDDVLGRHFVEAFRDEVHDEARPYEIVAFARRATS